MSSIIKLKKSLEPGLKPDTLATGEIAINIPDGKIYYEADGEMRTLVGEELAKPLTGLSIGPTSRIGQSDSSLSAFGKLQAQIDIHSPPTYRRRLTVFGSSVAFGSGATNDYGWAARLGIALQTRGFEYTNRSIGGNTSQNLIDRFYTDLVPTYPTHVIIGLSLANEGFLGKTDTERQIIYTRYINNMRKLVTMCRQQGYITIVTGVYPNSNYTPIEYDFLKQADQELENSDIPYINFLGTVDNGQGKWREGMFADGGHPNDIGHEAMFKAFPLSLFDNLTLTSNTVEVVDKRNAIRFTSAGNSGFALNADLADGDFGSLTAMCTLKVSGLLLNLGLPLITFEPSVSNGSPLRLRNHQGELGFAAISSDNIKSFPINTNSGDVMHIAVTIDTFTNSITLYRDGVSQGSFIWPDSYPIARIFFGGRSDAWFSPTGLSMSDFAVWRTALNPDQIKEAYEGRYSKASLCLLSPVVETSVPINSQLVNLAPNSANLICKIACDVGSFKNMMAQDSIAASKGYPLKNPLPASLNTPVLSVPLPPIVPSEVTYMADGSFTVGARVRIPANSGSGAVIFNVSQTTGSLYEILRLRITPEKLLSIVLNADESQSLPDRFINLDSITKDSFLTPRHLAVSYDARTLEISVFVDGKLANKTILPAPMTMVAEQFAIWTSPSLAGTNNMNYEVSDLSVHRIALTAQGVSEMANGNYRTRGLQVLSPNYEMSIPNSGYIENVVSPTIRFQWTPPASEVLPSVFR